MSAEAMLGLAIVGVFVYFAITTYAPGFDMVAWFVSVLSVIFALIA